MTPPPVVEPRKLPWRGLLLFSIAAAATILFVWIASELREGELDAVDKQVALALHQIDNRALDIVAISFTLLGTGPCLGIALAAVSYAAYRRGRRSYILILAANTIIAVGLNTILKLVFARARPTLFEVITRPDTYSFPSGHAMSAVTIYGAIAAVIIALRPSSKPLVAVVAMIVILGIGTSRVYLGAHWPMDVIAGWTAGLPFLVTTVHLLHRAQRGQ
jgi:membrane-associated phospholipid phosphatase